MRIFLSVGHSILKGGTCTSASGQINEYRYNKALAPYVKEELEKLGHTVDIIVCPEYKFLHKEQESTYKVPIANSGKYDMVAELHLNASNGQGNGSECLYYPNDTRGRLIADRFGQAMDKLGFKDRGAKPRGDLYMINSTKPLAVMFETFFCDSVKDTKRANDIGYRPIAQAIAYALTGVRLGNHTGIKPGIPNKPNTIKKEGGYSVLTNTPNDTLNVRQSPDYNSKILSSYRDKSKIYVHEVIKNNKGTFYKIEYKKGMYGYVSARYCVGIR